MMLTRWPARMSALAVPLVLAGALAGLDPAAAAAAPSAGCQAWTGAQPASAGSDNELNGVAVLSSCNAWTVGRVTNASGIGQTLTEHWNGSSWQVKSSPSPGTADNVLTGVAATSASNAWAVGFAGDSTGDHALIEHWDGLAWTVVPIQGLGDNTVLNAVSTVSASAAWAVGVRFTDTIARTLVLRWNGRRWAEVTSPDPAGSTRSVLQSVAAVSTSDVWAVGSFGGATDRTLILHWNGHQWAQMRSPSPGGGADDQLLAVAATSGTNAWAVGRLIGGPVSQTLILRWSGHGWVRVSSPNPAGTGGDNELFGVAATSPGNAWAVGGFSHGTPPSTLILHWNGRTWAHMASPNPGTGSSLFGVAATSAQNAWAVGDIANGAATALHCC